MLMKLKENKNFRFRKLMWSNIFKSQRVGERPYGSTAQPALHSMLNILTCSSISVSRCKLQTLCCVICYLTQHAAPQKLLG